MRTPGTPVEAQFKLAPAVSGVVLDSEVAGSLIERLLANSDVSPDVAERLSDHGSLFMVDINGDQAPDTDEGGPINLELDPGRKHDDSEIYFAFVKGAQRKLFGNPDSRSSRRSLEETRDSLIAIPRPLKPLFSLAAA